MKGSRALWPKGYPKAAPLLVTIALLAGLPSACQLPALSGARPATDNAGSPPPAPAGTAPAIAVIPTQVPTAAPKPAATAAPAARTLWRVQQTANLRQGPGTGYATTGRAAAGSSVEVIGTNPAGDWLQLADGSWLFAALATQAPAGSAPGAAVGPPASTTLNLPINLPDILGQSLAALETSFGRPTAIQPLAAGAVPNLPAGGESRTYTSGSYAFTVFYDPGHIARGAQLNAPLTDPNTPVSQWLGLLPQLAPLLGAPGSHGSGGPYSINYNGYTLSLSQYRGDIWTIQVWQPR